MEFFASFMGEFRKHIHDRAFMTDYFRRHTEEVIRTIAPERLLIHEVGQGWAPLCEFLGVSVPDEPFPSENSRAEFIARANAVRNDPAHFAAVLKK
jgi:Sulfotransferase domain